MLGIELDRPCGELLSRAAEAGLLISVTADTRDPPGAAADPDAAEAATDRRDPGAAGARSFLAEPHAR